MTKFLYTIGHSNRSFEAFLELIQHYGITGIVDVRSIPKSRHVPWFNQTALVKRLPQHHIAYHHLPKLGGRRSTNKKSINTGWHHPAFRGYADYMQTKEFIEGLNELMDLFKKKGKIAIMCAEAVPWRCHRSLISDAMIVRNKKVRDIISNTCLLEHKLTRFAVVDKKAKPIQVYYPEKNLTLEI